MYELDELFATRMYLPAAAIPVATVTRIIGSYVLLEFVTSETAVAAFPAAPMYEVRRRFAKTTLEGTSLNVTGKTIGNCPWVVEIPVPKL